MSRLTTSDGTTIAYEYDDSAPARELPPVVLLHGFAVDAKMLWNATGVADALADADRRTVVIDARGHGDSDKPADPSKYGEARMAQDVRELVDELGLDAYDLVGHSMGAVTAMLLATRDRRVRRLVVSGVGAGIVEVGGLDTRELPPGILATAFLAEHPNQIDHPLGQAWRSFATTIGADLPALAAQAQAMHQGGVALGAIVAPTLVLAGERDNLATRPEVFADELPDARIVTLPGADHLGTPTHPDYLPALLAFVGEQ